MLCSLHSGVRHFLVGERFRACLRSWSRRAAPQAPRQVIHDRGARLRNCRSRALSSFSRSACSLPPGWGMELAFKHAFVGAGLPACVHTDQLNTARKASRPSNNALVWRWDPSPSVVRCRTRTRRQSPRSSIIRAFQRSTSIPKADIRRPGRRAHTIHSESLPVGAAADAARILLPRQSA
jgi:hypothetical protein